MTKSRNLTKSRRCNKCKGRSGKRKSKKPRVSRRAHSLRAGSHVAGSHVAGSHVAGSHIAGSHVAGSHVAGSHVAGSHIAGSHVAGSHIAGSHVAPKKTQENPTIHTEESTNQHITHPTVDKESKWTKTGRALMYGVGAAGTGAFMGVLTAPLLAPKHYTDVDLHENSKFATEWKQFQQTVPEWMPLEQAKLHFLRTKDVEYYNTSHGKQNAIIGAGLAAAAAGTYGATRHKKDANATKPGKLTRAGRALMYGVGAVGTGAGTGFITTSKTEHNYIKGRNAMIGAGLAAVAAGTYGATRD